jgi:predicted ATPase
MGMLNSIINVDLHIHSFASKYKEDKSVVDESTVDNLDTLLEKLNFNHINLFAFSDHNRFDENLFWKAKEIIDSDNQKYPEIKNILPSVEFDVTFEKSKPSCHVIVIFDAVDKSHTQKIEKEILAKKLTQKDDSYFIDDFQLLLSGIGLNTLLIACQRKGLDTKNGGANCLSDACDDVFEILETGYISALEYQKPNVQGMIKKSLSKFKRNVSTIAGSDCHQWKAYPKHDENSANIYRSYYFTIKALPTFLGLLLAFTSPETRFNRKELKNSISSFSINGQTFYLSPGFNAIIGENGSGKTSLLVGISNTFRNNETYIKDILKRNCFERSEEILDSQIKTIHQSELVVNNNDGSVFGTDGKFPTIDSSQFKTSVDAYKNALISSIKTNISNNVKISSINGLEFSFDPDLDGKKTYFIDVPASEPTASAINPHEDRLKNLNLILKTINDELRSNDYYSAKEIEKLSTSFDTIYAIREAVKKKYLNFNANSALYSLISECESSYNTRKKSLSNDEDNKISEYCSKKNSFVTKVLQAIKANDGVELFNLPKIDVSVGSKEDSSGGFTFKTTLAYYQNKNIELDYLKKVFNSGCQTIDDIKLLKTKDLIIHAVSKVKGEDWEARIGDLTSAFLADECLEDKEVFETSSKDKMGNTLGEKSIVFYKFITQKTGDYQCYLIDQPEDNVSNYRISKYLIPYLERLRDTFQLIIVTHNPLLVINMDVDNVIYTEKTNNIIKVSSGCLESPGNLKKISDMMDGGKDALEKRLKIYEQSN